MHRTMVRHQRHLVVSQGRGDRHAFLVRRQAGVIDKLGHQVGEQAGVHVVHIELLARSCKRGDGLRVCVNDAVDVRPGLHHRRVKVDARRSGQGSRFQHLQIETDFRDMLGKRFVKVLKRSDPERVLTRNPQTHVAANLAVQAGAVQHAPRRGYLKMGRRHIVACRAERITA